MSYLITEDETYGYEAIIGICNYLKTLDIGYFANDQFREYGYTIYTASIVYDWCYDLLDDDLKTLLITGIEYNLCRGKSSEPDKAHHDGVKMEIGFPSIKKGGYITGHSCETQLLRDYLSYAIAVYDENPALWDLIGGRFYEDYVPVRQYMYSDGMFPDGTSGYTQMRFKADLRAEWIIENGVGKSPYNKIDFINTYRSMLNHVVGTSDMFSTGDGNLENTASMLDNSILAYGIFGDDVAYSLVRDYAGKNLTVYHEDHTSLNAVESFILTAGQNEPEYDSKWQSRLQTVLYNGGYYQQIISRNGFNGADTAAVLMRGAGRSLTQTSHSHNSFGSFQIYYKGFLSSDGGLYDSWGANHHLNYYMQTIAHNGLLIYNPALASSTYVGGQRVIVSQDCDKWMNDDSYLYGYVTGVASEYYDTDKKNPIYAYYANNLTAGYTSDTVDYVGRTMLTTYPQNDDVPMVFFVYDRIDAVSETFRKTFLLQCATEPIIDGNTITVNLKSDKGSSTMVLTSLKGADSINSYGATKNNSFYCADSGITYNPTFASTGDMWGRVEISPDNSTGSNKSSLLMNVIYVTDSGKTITAQPVLIETDDYIGASAFGQTAIFTKGTEYREKSFTVKTVAGTERYYIGGLYADSWTVKDENGNVVGKYTVGETEHFVSFAYNGNASELTFTADNYCEHQIDTSKYLCDETSHWHECKLCGRKFDITSHTMADNGEKTAVTGCLDGEMNTICSVCGYKSTRVLKSTSPHTYSSSRISDDKGSIIYTCSNCHTEKAFNFYLQFDCEDGCFATFMDNRGEPYPGALEAEIIKEEGNSYFGLTAGSSVNSRQEYQCNDFKLTSQEGILQFKVKLSDSNNNGADMKFFFMNSNSSNWSDGSRGVQFMSIKKNKLCLLNESAAATLSTEEWTTVTVHYILGDNMTISYYVNGEFLKTMKKKNTLLNKSMTNFHIEGAISSPNNGYYFDDVFTAEG